MMFLLLALLMPFTNGYDSQENKQLLQWEIAYHQTAEESSLNWLPATVPGAVQLDVMQAENYKQPYWFDDHVKQFDWMEDWFFTYRTTFEKPNLENEKRLFFHSKGIDYQFRIKLNGEVIHEQEGMFTYVDLDITDRLREKNVLEILLYPIPKVEGQPADGPLYRNNARESVKPAVSYGWDWHPRLVTRGIWDETYLDIRNRSYLKEANVTYSLDDGLEKADLTMIVRGEYLAGQHYRWWMKDVDGQVVLEKHGQLLDDTANLDTHMQDIALWWPNGYGEPIRYQSEFELISADGTVLDRIVRHVGFRSIKLIMNEGEWDRPLGFPATRNRAPASLEVNGKRIFAKGTNWVHPEIFIGKITAETYETHIRLAKDAHFNLLRVWGGGIVNKEPFFDLCDEMGMLVWQEFPLACNDYPDKPDYLAVLEQEATSIINRLKHRPCLAMWSGGNELFNSWSGMTDQSLALRLLNSLCYRLDPKTPFIPTSPLDGMAHGSYVFLDDKNKNGREVFQWMQKSDNTAYTEYGISGTSDVDVLKQIIPEDDLFPPKPGTAWEIHHAFGVWRADSWLALPFLEEYFGKSESLAELVAYSQLSQAEGLKFIYEEARRQKPYCSMAVNWCYQEPWPTAANNSLITYPSRPKPAYYAVAAACRPILASLSVPKFRWAAGDTLICEPHMLNDSYEKLESEQIEVVLTVDGNKEIPVGTWAFGGAEGFIDTKGPTLRIQLPDMKENLFYLTIKVIGKPEYNSTYTLLYAAEGVKKIMPIM